MRIRKIWGSIGLVVLVGTIAGGPERSAVSSDREKAGPAARAISTSFLASAQSHLAAREYWASETETGLQAPNRAQNLRSHFEPVGVRVHDRTAADRPALVSLRLAAMGRAGSLEPVTPGDLTHREHRVEIRRDGLVEWFENSAAGLEQGFTLTARPQPARSLREPVDSRALVLELAVDHAAAALRGEAVVLATKAGRTLAYEKLVVVDAAGRPLAAHFEVPSSDRIRLVVDEADARYPIVIDPILTETADTQLEGNQASAAFGASVASAGDVDGDGYADLIVGAPFYDAGQLDEGAAFVFRGSIGGVLDGSPLNAHAQLESNQSGGRFGASVASAGDVDGDGFSDVIVGAPGYTQDEDAEGAAFVFLGSSLGLADGSPATAHARLEGDATDSLFGTSVASAGDVDADGHADVVVGSPDYPRVGSTGGAFVFRGSPAGIANGRPATAHAEISPTPGSFSSLGVSVASAGDVDGDGFADLLVGASGYANGQADEGAAYVFMGSATGISDGSPATAQTVIEANQANAFLGGSVAAAGDVNGDGYGDIVIGASGYDAGGLASDLDEGVAFVFLGSATGIDSGAAGLAHAQLQANQGAASLGFSVAGAGDVNGDGFSDVLVGAPLYDAGQTNEGAMFVFLGSSDGISDATAASAYAQLESNQANAQLGLAVASAGDVDGDGYADVVAGSRFYSAGQSGEGAAFVYRGGATGLGGVLPGAANALLESNQSLSWMGESVASAGDVNGDGYSDIIVGAPFYDSGETNEGVAFVFLGSAGGVASASPVTAHARLEANQPSARFGASVASAGDVNGDGYGDIVVGAPDYVFSSPTFGNTVEGAVFVFHGSSSGIADGNAATADSLLRGFQGGGGLLFDPPQFGGSVASAGDLNGDGYGDLIVGAPRYDIIDFVSNDLDAGAVFLYHGSASGIPAEPFRRFWIDYTDAHFGQSVAAAGDFNGDGFGDVIVGAPDLDAFVNIPDEYPVSGAAYVFSGASSGASGGVLGRIFPSSSLKSGFQVASAGDTNGDGYDDVIVGAPAFEGSPFDGSAFIFYGSAIGLDVNPFLEVPHVRIDGDQPDSDFGSRVAGAGDVNADGFADVVVGAPLYDLPETNEGVAFVFAGSVAGVVGGGPGNAHARIEMDQAGAELGRSIASAGDVDGDGFADLVVGGPFFDSVPNDEGSAFVFDSNGTGSLHRPVLPSQRRGDGSNLPVQPWGRAGSETQFGVALRASHPDGLGRVRMQVEACPTGIFFGQPECTTAMSPSWVSLVAGTPDVSLTTTVAGLVPEMLYHWRARVLHAPLFGAIPAFPDHGPWRRLGGQADHSGIRTVPEAELGVALGFGVGLLCAVSRRRRRAVEWSSSESG